MNKLKQHKRLEIISLHLYDNSNRAIERETGVHRDTIGRLLKSLDFSRKEEALKIVEDMGRLQNCIYELEGLPYGKVPKDMRGHIDYTISYFKELFLIKEQEFEGLLLTF